MSANHPPDPARQAVLDELEHLAEHYEHPSNGEYGQIAARVLRDVVVILRAGGLVCEHRSRST
ncbi:MAG TPA: hypothetical protein VFA49_15525 [Chloroflexota bacterium]|jgi:hypothetical protein|nr:hypothetical protein [Chloroflexota bacterium]